MHNRNLPKRYLDILPCLAPSLPSQEPPMPQDCDVSCGPVQIEIPHAPDPVHSSSSVSNIFGLIQKYSGNKLPDHDAEDHLTFKDLCNRCSAPMHPADCLASDHLSTQSQSFLPYPNESSFPLGHWYWNEGQQKTLSGFQKLVEIVGNSSFSPSDVCLTDWDQINLLLAGSQTESDAKWVDTADEGWNITEIKIIVPFHCDTREPGSKIYSAVSLYHRSLIVVMREQVTDPHDFQYFHIEPYELLWHSPLNPGQGIHVHGKHTLNFSNQLENPDVNSHELYVLSCYGLMKPTLHHLALPNCGLFMHSSRMNPILLWKTKLQLLQSCCLL